MLNVTSLEEYTIKEANKNHTDEILAVLKDNFYFEETMFKSLWDNALLTNEEKELVILDHDNFIKGVLKKSPCLIIIEKTTEKIVGVNVTVISENPNLGNGTEGITTMYKDDPPQTQLVQNYFDYLTKIGKEIDVYAAFPNASRALEFYAICVDKNHRKKGLSINLMIAGISKAKETHPSINVVFGIFTSPYSRRAAFDVDLKIVDNFDLYDFKNDDLQPIFKDVDPTHSQVSLMALEI